jgi:integrase
MAKRPDIRNRLVPVLPLWNPEPITLCALFSGAARLTPKVQVLLNFLGEYVGTDRDPRLHRLPMRGCEIKGLRWRDVDMIGRALTAKRSKTEAGERVIPLNADAREVILALYKQSQELGGFEPGNYLFPAVKRDSKAPAPTDEGKGEKVKIDPTRPMKTWRTAWRSGARWMRSR